jgi:histidyl-tRNA synthetase
VAPRSVEVFPEPKKLGQQLKYADRRGFRVALVAGENEFAAGTIQVKNLATTESQTVPLDFEALQVIASLTDILSSTDSAD